MACDVDSGAGVTVAFQDISVLPTGEENSLDLYIEHQKDLRRNIVNQEFMVFHGNDPSRVSKARYLPPLPKQEKPKQLVKAWDCHNPAMRQLGNLSRRGPRQYLPGSATHRKPALISPELRRPHTAYSSRVKELINTRIDDKIRPKTSDGKIETMTFRQKCKPANIDTTVLIKPKKIPEPLPEELPEPEPLLTAPAGGFRRPGRYKDSPRKGQTHSKGTMYPNMEKKRLEDLGYLMKGNFHHLPPDIPTTVKIYLAGSKQDFLKEREVIAQEIMPVLREFCEHQGVEMELIDMGTKKDDIINMATQFSDLDKCQRESLGPFYVLLQGDYCTPMHMLPEIPASDFEALVKMTKELNIEHKHVLTDFYRKDSNCVPAKFIFQIDKLENKEDFKLLLNLWQNLLGIAEQASKFTTEKRHRYEAKSEHELVRIFQMFNKGAQGKFLGINCLCFYRTFQGLTERLSENTITPNFINVYEDEDSLSFDHQAQKRLAKLRDILKKYLPDENLKAYQLPWTGNGIDWENSDEHQTYLNSFIEDFIVGVKKLILNAKDQWKIKNKNGHLYGELLEHSRQCLYHARAFGERREEMQKVHEFVKNTEMNAAPLIVSGKSGAGKSAFIASLIRHYKEWLGKHCITVFRFLGVTPKSEDLLQVLVSLCLQICSIYNMDSPAEGDHSSINKMARHFQNILELVSKHHAAKKPLVLLLDGLEKLKSDHRADTLFWLPQAVPRNVYLILSVNSSDTTLHQQVLQKVKNKKSSIAIELGEFGESEVGGVVESIIKGSHRTLTDAQRDAVVTACTSYSNPLYISTLCGEAVGWTSDVVISQHMLPQTAGETISKVLYRLEDKYGMKFVQKLMSYICILSGGMSEKELYDVMCSDQEVLQILILEHDIKSNDLVVFDIISQKIRAILKDLDVFVTKVYIHGRHLIRWNCDKYRDTVTKKCFGALNPFTGRNDAMDDAIKRVHALFSAEKPVNLKLIVPHGSEQSQYELKSPTMPYHLNAINCRKLMVLPTLIASSGCEMDFSKQMKETCLCYFSFLFAKLQAFHPNEVFSDFNYITEKDHEIDALKQFFDITKLGIQNDPKTFALELLGCMPFLDEDYPLLNQLLVDAQNWVERVDDTLLIVPVFPSFPSPLTMCKAKLWNLIDIMSTDKTGRLGVMKNENGYIEIWDLENNEFVFNLGIRFDKVQPNVFTNRSNVLGMNGTELTVWEIQSGLVVHQVDVESLLGGHFSSVSVFCCSDDFTFVTIHTSDEEFNQSLSVIHISEAKLVHKISEFDVKDEFFKDSAAFVCDGEFHKMAFVMARSEVVNEKQNADFVKFKIFSTESMRIEQTIECGEKKFNKLLLKESRYAVVSWKDCSFDIYDLFRGQLAFTLAAPDSRLVIQDCCLTEDNYLVGLTSSLPDVDRKYYALWFWNTDEQTSVNLLTQSYGKSEETPKQFLILEELHVAVLATPNSTTLSVWDLPNSECIYSCESHVGSLDNILKAKDPNQIYSCSNNEEVVKLWDLSDVIRKAKEDKVQKQKNRSRSIITDVSSVRSNTTEGILKKKNRRILGKSKSVRFADEDISVWSEDVQSTKASEVSDDNLDLVGLTNGKEELTTNLCRDENVLSTQLDTMVGATHISFAQDSSFLILSSDRSLPTMWEMTNGHVIKRLEPHNDLDMATPWAELACDDQVVVGLTVDENSRDIMPAAYKYQVWDLTSGEPIHRDSELQFTPSVCALNIEKTRAVLCCLKDVQETSDPEKSNIKQHEVLQEANYLSISIPTQLQLMDDCSYCVTDNCQKPGESSQGFVVYHLEVNTGDIMEPSPYEYAEGDKFKEYRATKNVVLPNGQLSLSTGLNGDMQVWDITSCEYEGNLYSDPSVKDTRNPSLHNHSNKRILHMVVSEDGAYLVCAGADGTTSVWDLENEINVYTYGGHKSDVIRAAISRDNQLILTAGNDMFLNVWKLGFIDQPLCRLYIHSVITSIHISGDNKSVAVIGQRRNLPTAFMLFQLKNAPEPSDS